MEGTSCLNCGISSRRERRYMIAQIGPEIIHRLHQWLPQQEFSDKDFLCNQCMNALQRNLDEAESSQSQQQLGHQHVCAWCGRSILRIRSNALRENAPERILIAARISPRQLPEEPRVCYACWVAAKRNIQRNANVDVARQSIDAEESVASSSAEGNIIPQPSEQLEIQEPEVQALRTEDSNERLEFNWDDSAVLLLIEKYQENELLWNPRHMDFKNRNKRNDAVRDIASVFNIASSEIERKLKNLSSHYFREKRKYEESKRSGSGRDDVQLPKWFAYKALSFLNNKNAPSSQDNITSQTTLLSTRTSRKRNIEREPEVDEALQLLREITSNARQRDDAAIFADYISSKLRKMDHYTMCTVQHQIQNIVYEAEMRMGDVFISDRGFRDAIINLVSYNNEPHKPESLEEGETQLPTIRANKSRCVTICRWVIEVINGKFKRDYKLLRQTYFNNTCRNVMTDFRIAAALVNVFHKLITDRTDAPTILNRIRARMDVPNQLGDFIEDHNVNRRRAAFSPINGDLPQLKKKEAEQKKIEKIETKKRKDELKKQKKTTTKAQNKKSKKNNRSAKTAKQRKVSSSEDESEEEGDTPCMYCEEFKYPILPPYPLYSKYGMARTTRGSVKPGSHGLISHRPGRAGTGRQAMGTVASDVACGGLMPAVTIHRKSVIA
ncbi:hypothetical protein HW555_013406 [Spodoptera exigua]|uniref:MADF domain-containing protein n=1 Tax=Spodoptera exigua TaxID=7107 RepID=A0A835G566_SPOEX|nr:hypothetical protein HW555_013406 [Spodoptera exigua]